MQCPIFTCIFLDFINILTYNLKCHNARGIHSNKMFSYKCNYTLSFFRKLKDSFKKVMSILLYNSNKAISTLLPNSKKLISTILSISILYSQLFFSILATQSIISTISATSVHAKDYSGFSRDPSRNENRRIRQDEGSSSRYSPQSPYQNIKDNPINNIIIDESMCAGGYDSLGNCVDGTALDRTQNGTPMVNINNATSGGVSANYYKKLDVNQENLILNNYKGEAVNTHLGGVIYGNPNMNGANGRMADIILNEITSNQQTNITGHIEVAGKKADVIIANPNGIMVSGSGFINTARLSLITGKSLDPNTNSSLDANGNLNPFKLSSEPNAVINVIGKNITNEKGEIVGYNIGIDAQNTDYLTLISRVANISGDIIGSADTTVEIKTGNDRATYNKITGEFDVVSDDAIIKAKPQFAFDSTAMGGIYAGKVSIVATEHGVGVRTRGDVVAYVDDINFDADGNIILQDTSLQTLDQTKSVNIKNKTTTTDQYTITIDNSNIYAGHIDIQTDNLQNKNDSIIFGIDSVNIDATDKITNDSTIYANYDIKLKSNNLSNVSGEITSYGDITIDLLTNFITEGVIGSTYGTTTITAENITIDNDKDTGNELTGHNIVLNSRNDITNTATSTLIAENDIILNAIIAVYNDGNISAGDSLSITAGKRIINQGSLQAIGVFRDYIDADGNIFNAKDPTTGNLTLFTKANTNSDYRLNDLGVISDYKAVIDLPEYAKEKIDNLNSITNLDELSELLAITLNTNNEAKYYLVQKRIRYLAIQNTINEAKDTFIFNSNNFEIGSEITIEEEVEQLDADGNSILDEDGNKTYIIKTHDKLLNEYDIEVQLRELLGDQKYEETIENWTIDLTELESKTNKQIQDQLDRLEEYNEEHPDSSLTLEQFIELNPTGIETIINKEQILTTERTRQEAERLTKIETEYKTINDELDYLSNEIDWNNLTEDQTKQLVAYLHSITNDTDSYNKENWSLTEFDTSSGTLSEYTKYLLQTRTNNKDQTSIEQTGIHNYGRLYSNSNMTLTSNSVLHNNKDSLIYSGNSMHLNIADILFNNAGGTTVTLDAEKNIGIVKDEDKNIIKNIEIGYGIISKGDININGTNGELSRLNKLINYDGRIEADYDINIRTNETINYGSDSCNYFVNPNCAVELRYEYYGLPPYSYNNNTTKMYGRYFNESTLTSNQSNIVSNYGNIDINSNDRITNYNSIIYGKNSITLKTDELFNTIAEFVVNDVSLWARGTKKRKKTGSFKDIMLYLPNQYHSVLIGSIGAEARIVSQGTISITSDSLNNGAYKPIINNAKTAEENETNEQNNTEQNTSIDKLPYSSKATDNKTLLDKAIDTGKLDLLDIIKLPTNNHGIFRKTNDTNTKFLYETDPLFIDISRFLGSQYFLNRIGLDPFSIDQKFLGDAYMEHSMIKTYLEQIGFFQNNKITDQEIDEYINNLFKTLNPEKIKEIENASGQKLEFGKELTQEQINNLTEDIVWYVSKTITTPDGETMKVLVPQIYLAQETVNKLLANSSNHAELQSQLSIKQATDKAITESTNAGNSAINTELDKISQEAQQQAKESITEQDKSTATENTQKLITNNQEDYDALVQQYLESFKQEASTKITSLSAKTNNQGVAYIYVDPDSVNKCNARAIACMTRFAMITEAQALDLAKQKAYNEIYNNELNKIETAYYNQIYTEKSTIFYENDAETVFQTAYDKTYQPTYDTAFTLAQSQNSASMNTGTMIAGDNILIQGKDNAKSSTLNNSGTIWGNRQVVITTDQINNATSSMNFTNKDGTKTIAAQATIIGGDLVYLNTIQYKTDDKGNYLLDETGNKIAYSQGQVNNISGMVGTFNKDSTTYIATGDLNNITNSQREEYSHHTKKASYEEIRTYIGTTAQIVSAGNLIIDAANDISMIGAGLLANNNIQITAGNNFNSTTIEDYNRTYSRSEQKNIYQSSISINETASLKNLNSSIYANNNMTIIANNDITAIGTNFGATDGDINLIAENNLTLKNAMDWDYNYSFQQKQRMDLATIAVSTVAGFATGGPMGAIAGAYSGTQSKVGRTDMTEDYKETTAKTTLTAGGNINLQSGKDMTLISTDLTAGQDIYSYSGGQTFIGTVVESSFHNEFHQTNKRNLLGAAVGGAIGGVAASVGMVAGGLVGGVYAVDYISDMTAGISTNTKIQESGYNNNINNASNLNADGTITTIAEDSLTIAGSNLSADYGITLASLNSNVNILDVKDTYSDYSREYTKGFDKVFVEFDQQLSAGVQYNETEEKTQSQSSISTGSNITSDNGNINIIANHSKEKDENGNSINTGNILQVGSTVYSNNGNINYTANDGDIFLLAGQNTNSSSYQYDQTTITAGVKIGNAYVDVAYAADAVVKAGEELKNAKDELDRIEQLYKEGKASKDAVEDAKLNVAMATVNLANATVAAAASVAGAATAAGTSFGTGMYASVFMNYDTNSTKSTEQSLWNTSSNVIADNGNITFNAGNDMLQEGSNVFAQNGTATYDIGNDLILRAIADTFFSETKSENLSGGVSVGNNAVQINIGAGESTSRTRSTTYNNSQTIAKNILINTGNNATFSGANILAQKNENGNGGNLTMNIGNNLTIESLQDTYYSKGNSWSASLGIGIGTGDMGPALRGATSKPGQSNKGNNSGNIGFSVGRDRTDSSWVNNQTSLIGNNSVSVNVGTREGSEGKTTITGAIIASGQYETITNSDGTQSSIFVDNNNLNLNTKDLIYTDLNDFYISESKGFGMSTGGGTTSDSGKQTLAPSGSTTVNLKNTGEEREQITKTTIGNGSINVTNTINGEKVIVTELKDENGNVLLDDNGKPKTVNNIDELLIGLNRNVNTSQEITKDQITGALDGSVTVDNRVLLGFMSVGQTPVLDENGNQVIGTDGESVMRDVSGWESIGNDFTNFGTNAFTTISGIVETIALIPGNPITLSREKDIAPHPFPSLGIGDEVMGRSSFNRDENNMPIPDKGSLNMYTQVDSGAATDRNPFFRFLYAVVPGGKSMTDNHDIESNRMVNEMRANGATEAEINKKLATTIPTSFAGTLYGIIGTALDVPNYSSNAQQIKNSYNNGVPKNVTIIRDTNGNTIHNDSWRLAQ